mgnify:CR=1 FL=1
MLVKVAPDLSERDIDAAARVLGELQVDGVIATNTTIDHSKVAGDPLANEAGGLSGAPVLEQSTLVLRRLRSRLPESVPLIGVGGILSGADAVAKTAAGAHAFRAQGDQRHLFVSNRTANSISRIDMQTLTVTDTFAVPGGPDCMDVLADGKTLLVTSRWARKLTVVDLEQKKVSSQVPVGKSPHGVWTLNHAPTR